MKFKNTVENINYRLDQAEESELKNESFQII